MTSRLYDLARLKRAVSVGAVLAHYGLNERLRPRARELVGRCPLPDHAGDRDNRDAFHLHPGRGLWRCTTHCGGGDLVALVAHLEGGSHAAAARALARIDQRPGPLPPPWHPDDRAPPTDPFRPYTKTLRLDAAHAFLRARGVRPETAAHFEAGHWPLGGFLRGCVAARIHDPAGNPLGYAGRRLAQEDVERYGKWTLPRGIPKARLLYNWHRAQHYLRRGLVLVEGPWDAMRVHQAGFPNVVALWGTDLSPDQHALIQQAPSAVLLLDGDTAGRTAAPRCAAALHPRPVRIVALPQGQDPADLTDQAIRNALSTFP